MSLFLLALAATAADPNIVVTAARVPVPAALSGTAIGVVDAATITAVALPLAVDLLRLVPSVAVASTGPLGSQTQVRIRGAEANQTLTFIDGIKVNDPASGGEFRWETLLADGIDRIEVLRGPQSALWGSEAIGGVVNILTRSPAPGRSVFGQAEGGSFGTWAVGGGGNYGSERGGIAAQASYRNSTGIDTSDSGGDRDGYRNLTSTAKVVLRPGSDSELGLVVRHVDAKTRFDDFDYATGQAKDAPLSTDATATALRGYAHAALLDGRWAHQVEVVYNGTGNKNYTGNAFQNRSDGSLFKAGYQTTIKVDTAPVSGVLTGAIEHEVQTFRSADADPLALSNQDRRRNQVSVIADYRATYRDLLAVGASVRHDANSQYANTTTFRATAALALPQGLRAHASYGEGVSDPSFFDLYGYFPAYFAGNPALIPETSRGWDAGLGWAGDRFTVDATWFHSNLLNEIVSTYDYSTGLSGVANASGESRRQGLELSAAVRLADWLRLEASYAYLDATEQRVAGTAQVRELRRPRHSGALTAIAGRDAWQLAASAAFVGRRYDTDFATFSRVTLPAYALLTLSGSYRISDALALTARVENAANARYQDVSGYRTMGIGAFAGVRIKWRG